MTNEVTEISRTAIEDEFDLVMYKEAENDFAFWLEPHEGVHHGWCLAAGPTELEALVAARVALWKIYKACPEPERTLCKQ